MPKEFAGGPVPEGFFRVPVEWSEEVATAVPICQFNFDSLDSLTGRCMEAMAEGRAIETIVEAHVRAQLALAKWEWLCEGLNTGLAEILGAQDPRKAAAVLCFAAGLHLTLGKSITQIGKEAGVTKQDIHQAVERLEARLGQRLVRLNKRDDEAREHMRKRNYRSKS